MQTPAIVKCEDNRGVENASPHFYLLRHHILLLQEFAISDFYKLKVWGLGQETSGLFVRFRQGGLIPRLATSCYFLSSHLQI